MNNEYYAPMDKEHKTGYLGYTYFGYENNKFIAKNISIKISTKKWTLYTNDMQPLLFSGVNIKTINGESIIGSGNMIVSGSGDPFVRVSDSETSGLLSTEDHQRLISLSALAILRNGTMYYLGETNLITDMYYYPHKPEEGFTEEYIFVPINAPQWELVQQV